MDNLKAKGLIKKLRRITTENGCSANEQYQAMVRIRDLMDKHGLTDAMIDMGSRRCERAISSRHNPRHGILAIFDRHFGVDSLISYCPFSRKRHPVVYGRTEIVEQAAYAIDAVQSIFDKQVRAFRKTPAYILKKKPKSRRAAVEDYEMALLFELSEKYPPKPGWREDHEAAKAFRKADCPDTRSIKSTKLGGKNDLRAEAKAVANELGINTGVEVDDRPQIGGR